MASWDDVERIAAGLPGARLGSASDDSPTYDIGKHPFARLRWDERGREILQFWSMDPDAEDMLADRRDIFFRVDAFKVKTSVWAWLDRLDEQDLAEVLAESHRARRGARR